MRLFSILLFLTLAGLAITAILYPDILTPSDDTPALLPNSTFLLQQIQQEISAPPPLTGSLTDPGGVLTINEVFQATNQHRAEHNADHLALNQALNQAAQAKLNDMFAQQYFEHVSPDGIAPADVATNAGYQYIRVGENLALGNYADSATVVQAWMDSPGHRANILSSGFTEIGIAVGQGQYEEHDTWLAVQTFGLPSSTCPSPGQAAQNTFNQNKLTLDSLSDELTAAKQEIDSNKIKLNSLSSTVSQLAAKGNDKIEQGNQLVAQGNDLMQDGQTEEATKLHTAGQALQEEGEQLIEQARAQQEQSQDLAETQQQLRNSYNQQVEEHNQLNEKTATLATTINKQIRAYNTCVEQYQE